MKYAQQNQKRGDYIGVFFDQRGKSRYNLPKMHIKRKDSSPPPNAYKTAEKWNYDRSWNGESTLKFLPSARKTFIDEITHEAKRQSSPGPASYKLNWNRTERRSQQFSTVK